MARNKTSFTPATAPKGKGGSKHLKTRIKEAVGLDNYQTMIEYLKGEGLQRVLNDMREMNAKDHFVAFTRMWELNFPKPKAEAPAQSEFGGVDFFVIEDYNTGAIDYNKLSDSALEEIANARIRPDFNPPPIASCEDEVVP